MAENSEQTGQSYLPLFFTFIILGGLVCCYFLWPSFQDFVDKAYSILTSDNEQRISQWVDSFGFWGPLLLILIMVVQMFLLVVPSPLVMVVSVLAYGPVWGSLISLAGIITASTLGYFIGKYLGPITVQKLIGHKTEIKIENYIEEYGFWTIIVARISPILSNDATSFVAGILKMGYFKFMGATLLGIIPLTILIAILGENIDRLKTGLIWVSVISFVALIGYIIYDKRKQKS